jgi:hypothetical protein
MLDVLTGTGMIKSVLAAVLTGGVTMEFANPYLPSARPLIPIMEIVRAASQAMNYPTENVFLPLSLFARQPTKMAVQLATMDTCYTRTSVLVWTRFQT